MRAFVRKASFWGFVICLSLVTSLATSALRAKFAGRSAAAAAVASAKPRALDDDLPPTSEQIRKQNRVDWKTYREIIDLKPKDTPGAISFDAVIECWEGEKQWSWLSKAEKGVRLRVQVWAPGSLDYAEDPIATSVSKVYPLRLGLQEWRIPVSIPVLADKRKYPVLVELISDGNVNRLVHGDEIVEPLSYCGDSYKFLVSRDH